MEQSGKEPFNPIIGRIIKTIEDNGSQEEESQIYGWGVTERHIKE